jgi:hypothetical protein
LEKKEEHPPASYVAFEPYQTLEQQAIFLAASMNRFFTVGEILQKSEGTKALKDLWPIRGPLANVFIKKQEH